MASLKEIKKRLGRTDKLSKELKEDKQPNHEEYTVAYEPSDHPNYADLNTFSRDIQDLSTKELNVLFDFTCAKGLHEHVEKLLERSDLDPNVQQGSGDKLQNYPLLKAAFLGYHDVLRILKKDGRINFKVQYKGDTILHLLLKRNETDTCNVTDCDYQECLNLILDNSKQNPIRESIKEIVNRQDLYENTPLHYATQKWPQSTVRKLLDFGANIGIKNEWQEIPISKIRPETIKDFLDSESCLTSKKDVVNENFSITFHYDFLARDKHSVPKSPKHRIGLQTQAMSITHSVDEEQGMEMNDIGGNHPQKSDEKQALPETESLWYMGQSKEHRHLLKHPVIASFLWYKWKRIRKCFNRNLRFYALFVFLLTWYIFDNYGSYVLSKSDSGKNTWYFAMIVVTVGILVFIWHDLMADIKDLKRRKRDRTVTKSCLLPYTIDVVLVTVMIVILILTSFTSERNGERITTSTILRIALIAMLSVLGVREGFQLLVSLKRYVTSFENWIEVTLIGLAFKMLCNQGGNFEENRHLAAITTFLAWAELVTMVGKHPKLHRLNIYVTMFSRVLKDFILFLAWYSMFIVAFGFGFYIMLHTDTAPALKGSNETEVKTSSGSQKSILRCSNGSELEVPISSSIDQVLMCPDGTKLEVKSDNKEETYEFFNKTWLSLVKTSTMFIGELEFSDIPINLDSDYAPLSYLFLLLFVLLVVIILMNLLTGLAVGDIGEIRQKAEIYAFISQVETISYMESMMLGDPFDFLKNVPKVLSWIDSCSVCSLLYKFGPIRQIFLNIGSGILLFYDYLENKRSEEIKPNKRKNTCNHTLLSFGSCSCLSDDDMDGHIVASAKEIIVQRNRAFEEESREKRDQKEKEMSNRKIKEMDKEEEKARHKTLERQLRELSLVVNSLKTCPCPVVKVKL